MMPHKDNYNSIIFLWLILIPLMIFMCRVVIDNQITTGDILAFVIPVVIAIIVFFGRIIYYSVNFYTLGVNPKEYLHPDYEGKETKPLNTLKLPLGESTHVLVIRAKADVVIKEVHFHLNNNKSKKGLTPKKTIEIVNLDRPPDTYYEWDKFNSRVNSIGGCDGKFQDVKDLTKGTKFYLQIDVNAHEIWDGYLVFYSKRSVVSGKGYAYLRVEVNDE